MARPKSESARLKALSAAGDIIIERGVERMTIEEVASRSGVAKTTIYRRWPERAALIVDTVQSMFEHVCTPDTGSFRGDLESYFEAMSKTDLNGRVGRLMPSLLAGATRDEELSSALDTINSSRERPVRTIMRRAIERGELADELNIDVIMGMLIGPLLFRKLVQQLPSDPDYTARCLDVALGGLGVENSTTT